tara:strand:- start:2996 stop:4441 length:1446 start_codon:yes stop_codon:yes gene_type:complete
LTFQQLNLIPSLLQAVEALEYTSPTPIQHQAIPPLLEGRDVLGCAQTGTGKTAAFALPVLQRLSSTKRQKGRRRIRALVLSPTRELAIQIGEAFEQYGAYLDHRYMTIFGGVSQNPQVRGLNRGVDVLIATPGRLLDLQGQGHIDLSSVEFFVLDEADQMLDMGFIHDIKRVVKTLPTERQNLLFSATMPPKIVKLASSFLHEPIMVEVARESTVVENIVQEVMFVEQANKKKLLVHLLLQEHVEQAIIFTRTKRGANRLTEEIRRAMIKAVAIHGNKSQNARRRALNDFKSGDTSILVATDIASRGIDIDGVSHVFNYDLPNEPESYVHRIGRTGRAGRGGRAIAFCDPSESEFLRDIERLTGVALSPILEHPWHCEEAIPSATQPSGRRSGRRRPSSQKRPAKPPRPKKKRPPRDARESEGKEGTSTPKKKAPRPRKARNKETKKGDGAREPKQTRTSEQPSRKSSERPKRRRNRQAKK